MKLLAIAHHDNFGLVVVTDLSPAEELEFDSGGEARLSPEVAAQIESYQAQHQLTDVVILRPHEAQEWIKTVNDHPVFARARARLTGN